MYLNHHPHSADPRKTASQAAREAHDDLLAYLARRENEQAATRQAYCGRRLYPVDGDSRRISA